jgi:hypothetical protein
VDTAAGYECRLDEKRWKRCESPARYSLKRGRHHFRVRALAANGEHGPAKKAVVRVKRRR